MKIYPKNTKSTSGFGYWGDFGEIDVGLSSGLITDNNTFSGEKLHYHQLGVIYFVVIDGSGVVEVEGQSIEIKKDTVLRIDPGEKYRVTKAINYPFNWLVFCTSKDRQDKVIVDN